MYYTHENPSISEDVRGQAQNLSSGEDNPILPTCLSLNHMGRVKNLCRLKFEGYSGFRLPHKTTKDIDYVLSLILNFLFGKFC